jgi:fermentation-respiration switch protein FrsA (DUF1100 family)
MALPRAVRVVATATIGGWLLICVAMYLLQDSMVYFPSSRIAQTPAATGLDFEDVVLETEDGEKLGAWLVRVPGARGTVLFCHGNAGNISHRISTLKILADLGMDVLIFDYRGFGTSTGKPSEEGLYTDAMAAWRFLGARGTRPERTIIMGRSLGGGVAVWLASQVDAAGLVAESTFTSAVELGGEHYPFLPVSLLLRHRFGSIERIAEVGEPVLVAHSDEDTLIPSHHGRALFSAAKEPKKFLALAGDHNDTVPASGAAYVEGLDAFFSRVLPAQAGSWHHERSRSAK